MNTVLIAKPLNRSNPKPVSERAFWLAWSQINGVGPVLLRRLQQRFGSLSAAWTAPPEALQSVEGIGGQTLAAILAQRTQLQPEGLLAAHQHQNPNFWVPSDPHYPRLLQEITDPPPLLYYQGQWVAAENQGLVPMVAMVGTRDPSEYGKRWTRQVAYALAKNGFTIVSGMAEGIDTQAHLGCLEGGGRTIAVLGTGVNVPYPPRNGHLHQTITERGLVVSEYPAGTQPSRAHFPRRNRIIAGLSRAVLVMEAPQKSGALITAYLANDYNRDVYVLPHTLDNVRGIGCLGLVHRGAHLILGIGQLLDLLGRMPTVQGATATEVPTPTPLPPLPPEQERLVGQLRELSQQAASGEVPFDLLVEHSQQAAGDVSSALLHLELLGIVVRHPGMRYSIAQR